METTGGNQALFRGPTAYTFGGLSGVGALALTNAAGSAVTLTVGGNNATTAFGGVINSGVLGAGGSLVKVGSGTLTLSGDNTYRGTTDVNAGKLVVNGVHSGGGLIAVRNGAELGGEGQVGNVTVQSGGTLSPGNSIGLFETANLTLEGGSKLVMALSETTSDSDKILVSELAYSGIGKINVDLFGGKLNTTYTLIGFSSLNNIGLGDFAFDGANLGAGLSVGPTSLANNELQLTVIPEPASIGTLGLLAVAVILRRRLRRV